MAERYEKENYRVVGSRRPYVDAKEKVTGRARYVTDVHLPGMLVGRALRSPHPHARILNIDTTEARKVPGVKVVLTGAEVEQNKWGPVTKDEYLLARDKVRFVGDEVAAVVAVDEDACAEALERIRVDYEPLPAILSLHDAMKEGAPQIHDEFARNVNHHFEIPRGDVDAVFAKADFVFEDEYETDLHYQGYMEPMGGVSVWDHQGNVTIYAGIQTATWSRRDYAHALNVPAERVRIVQPLFGGGFGAKLSQPVHPLGALMARYARQPVRLVLSREEDFQCGLPRLPMYFKLRTAWSRDGKFLGKDVYIIADQGAYASYGAPIALTAMYRIDILYQVANVRSVCDLVYTNKVPTGCFRGFGNAQMHFAQETHFDQVAHELGIDPVELRHKNLAVPDYVNPHGWKVNSCEVAACLDKAVAQSSFQKKREEFAKTNASGDIKRGIGAAVCVHVSGNRSFIKEFEGAAVLLRLNDQGHLYIYSNEPDMGQGIRTVTSMCAAEILGLDPEYDIAVPDPDTNVVPFGLGCFASRGTYLVSGATKNAALDMKKKLLETASTMMDLPPEKLTLKEGAVVSVDDESVRKTFAEVSWQYICDHSGQMMQGLGHFTPPDVHYPDAKKYGNISGGYAYGCHIAEVEVNVRTGQVRVPAIWAVHDVGQAINELSVEGQIDGGVTQGYGWALMEKLHYGADGKLRNPSFLDYQIPTAGDVPKITSSVVNSFEWTTGFGAKSIGEASLIAIVPAIGNAIYNATGVRLKEVPMTAEKVLQALKEKEGKEA